MAYINDNKIINVEVAGLVNVDDAMSSESTNPVQNKVIEAAKQDKFGEVAQTDADTNTVTLAQPVTYFKADDNNYVYVGTDGVIVNGERVIVANGQLGGGLNACGNKITELAAPEADNDAANKRYVDKKTDWVVLSSGELDDTTGGVKQIKALITEDVTNLTELKFYVEFPCTTEIDGTTPYVDAHISGNFAGENVILYTYGKVVSGSTYRTMSQGAIMNTNDGKFLQIASHALTLNLGINSSSAPIDMISDWIFWDDGDKYLYLRTSQAFPSGTKWVLEGR